MYIGETFYCSKCMRVLEEEGACPFCGYDGEELYEDIALPEGTVLMEERYLLGAVIGKGGFGITYSAWDYRLQRPVAVKEYFPDKLCKRDAMETAEVTPGKEDEAAFLTGLNRFAREARILGTLGDIPGVVSVLDWFEINNTAYIVMEFIHGKNLEAYAEETHLPPQKLIASLRGLFDALVLVHAQGIIHRDISPRNIVAREDGSFVLIDFGAAIVEKRREEGLDRTVIYSRDFSPPEQYQSDSPQGPWTDVYAFCATIFYLVTGQVYLNPSGEQRGRSRFPKNSRGRLKSYQEKAILAGLVSRVEGRIQTIEHLRALLYRLPLPAYVRQQKRSMALAVTAGIFSSLLVLLLALNFTVGYPLKEGLFYSLRMDGFHVVGSDTDVSSLTVPGKVLGIPVTQIGERALLGEERLVWVSIPGSIKSIGAYAFAECSSMRSLELGEGVLAVGSAAFTGCDSLQVVTVPDSLRSIAGNAFDITSGELVLLGSMESKACVRAEKLGLAFQEMTWEENAEGVTLLRCESSSKDIRIPDEIGHRPVTAIGDGEAVFPLQCESILLPSGLVSIGDRAFMGSSIEEIHLPDGLGSIGESAFSQTRLETLSLPDSVTQVGRNAFSSCQQLQTVRLSGGMEAVPGGCFDKCSSLVEAELSEGIEEIGAESFGSCHALTLVKLPESLRLLEKEAFRDCASLQTLYLPSAITDIQQGAFDGCPNSLLMIGEENSYAQVFAARMNYGFYNLSDQDHVGVVTEEGNLLIPDVQRERETAVLTSYGKWVKAEKVLDAGFLKSRKVYLPEEAKTVSAGSFYGNVHVEDLICNEGLLAIERMAFAGCRNLSVLRLPKSLERIESAAFSSCASLTKVTLPEELSFLGEGAFENCGNLTEVTIPSRLVTLESDVFAGTGLSEAVIPGTVAKCRTAFYGCRNLKKAVVEEGVRSLQGTFAHCENLEEAVLPSTLAEIGASTFLGCQSLRDVWIYASDLPLDSDGEEAVHVEYRGLKGNPVSHLEKEEGASLFQDCPNVTIHGRKGSGIEAYAAEHGIPFEAIAEEENLQG